MEPLNDDILREIALQLRGNDWKAFRLTCRAVARALSAQINFLWSLRSIGYQSRESWETMPPDLLRTFSAAHMIRLFIIDRAEEPSVALDFYARKLEAMAYTAYNVRFNKPRAIMDFRLGLHKGSQWYLPALDEINFFGCSLVLEGFDGAILHVPRDCGAVGIEYATNTDVRDLRISRNFPQRLFAKGSRLRCPDAFRALHRLTRTDCELDLAFCNEPVTLAQPWSLEEVRVHEATAAIDLIIQFRRFVRMQAVKAKYVLFFIVFEEKRLDSVDDALVVQIVEMLRDLLKHPCTKIDMDGNCFWNKWFSSVSARITAMICEAPELSTELH